MKNTFKIFLLAITLFATTPSQALNFGKTNTTKELSEADKEILGKKMRIYKFLSNFFILNVLLSHLIIYVHSLSTYNTDMNPGMMIRLE